MNMQTGKKQIIEAIETEKDEWVLKAIKKLLDIDYSDDLPEDHLFILNERLEEYKNNPTNMLDWEDVKKDLSKN